MVDFTVPADLKVKIEQTEKRANYLDLARELIKLWNMMGTVIPIITGALGTVCKGSWKGDWKS